MRENRIFAPSFRTRALKTDGEQVVLAYGSWKMVAGRAAAACNKGNPSRLTMLKDKLFTQGNPTRGLMLWRDWLNTCVKNTAFSKGLFLKICVIFQLFTKQTVNIEHASFLLFVPFLTPCQ